MKEQKSLFSRTFNKEDVLNRERLINTESHDVPLERVNIKRAADKAIATMRKQIGGYECAMK